MVFTSSRSRAAPRRYNAAALLARSDSAATRNDSAEITASSALYVRGSVAAPCAAAAVTVRSGLPPLEEEDALEDAGEAVDEEEGVGDLGGAGGGGGAPVRKSLLLPFVRGTMSLGRVAMYISGNPATAMIAAAPATTSTLSESTSPRANFFTPMLTVLTAELTGATACSTLRAAVLTRCTLSLMVDAHVWESWVALSTPSFHWRVRLVGVIFSGSVVAPYVCVGGGREGV